MPQFSGGVLRSKLIVLYIAFLLALSNAASAGDFAIAIHGGAGGNPAAWPEEYRQARLNVLETALDAGIKKLESGEEALTVVEFVIKILEDDPHFNAGRGCVLNADGKHELDASIMDGKTLACGAVAGVTTPRHPITLARRVMTDTKHVMLSGPGADAFCKETGIEQATAEHFITEQRLRSWKQWKRRQSGDLSSLSPEEYHQPFYFGTVGCVVLDSAGNLAAGTSTGGLNGKQFGRVGDSPIIGAGTYADNATCAVSGTGVGEEFIRKAIASDIAARMRYGKSTLKTAVKDSIASLPENCGGVISLNSKGDVFVFSNTPGMSQASQDASGKRIITLKGNVQ